jgi:hypothetical protein
MTELNELVDDLVDEKAKEKKKPEKYTCVGLDVGTMHLVCSRSDSKEINISRNVFLPLSSDDVTISELTDISYVEGEDGELFIIGEDAFKFANIFNQTVSRPMEKGLISAREISAIDVLTLMIKDLVGNSKDKEIYCSYSIPAEAIDEGRSVSYHESVFARILGSLGINYTSVNEAMAIIYSECAKEKFSGIGISFGAGMANCAIAYKGIEALKFSTARAGDWVDKQTAESLGMVANRVTNLKERHLDLTDLSASYMKNKRQREVMKALYHFHEALINYTVKKIIKEFDEKVDLEIDDSIPIIVSGGSSLPKGFLQLFKSVLNKYELPFDVSEIRRARNPLTAVANGLLVRTMADVKK